MLDTIPRNGTMLSPFATTHALRRRLVEALITRAALNHSGLNENLRYHLSSTSPEKGALVSDPVIEGIPAYVTAEQSFSELAGHLLTPEIVSALTQGNPGEDYYFDPSSRPYWHQIESWRQLLAGDPRSVLVTSGTGSGKTECFLIPLLDSLCREATKTHQKLSGVRAIMLYPLNALIASQRERLRRWTAPFAGQIRFGMYNGLTPEDLRRHDHQQESVRHPEEIIDRKTMRADPPPVLVTNVTMLEYLTIRREDRPLVQNSKGKLRWVIVDEAHSYVGSAAAEIALLLRRVLQSFDVKPEDIRFIATSATIGNSGDDAHRALKRFLSDLAGVDETKIHVIEGRRAPIVLPNVTNEEPLNEKSFRVGGELTGNSSVQKLVRALEQSPLTLASAREILAPTKAEPTAVMEALAHDSGHEPLLPLRVHQFVRAVPGLWCCLNAECTGNRPSDWPFGALAFEHADCCPHCQALLFEVHGCAECGEPFLAAFEQNGKLEATATAPIDDEFAAASENEAEESDEESEGQGSRSSYALPRMIATRSISNMSSATLDPLNGMLLDGRNGNTFVITRMDWEGSCPNCRAHSKDEEGPLRPFRFGAAFLIGNAAPVLLDGIKPLTQRDEALPADGRRLLSFTDSRQGTARFAANIETNSERAYLRGYIYHLVQKSALPKSQDAGQIKKQRDIVEALRKVVATSPGLQDVLQQESAKLAALELGDQSGLKWSDVALQVAHDPIVQNCIREVWGDRDRRFSTDREQLGRFLLLRELARKPKRANALETLGMVQLRFDALDRLRGSSIPQALRARGRTVDEWRDLLYLLIDTPVRSYFALNVSWDDVRWLLPRGGVRRDIVGPESERRSKSDLLWPQARPGVGKSNSVLLLERLLGIDVSTGEGRSEVNEILWSAWNVLRPLFEGAGATLSLDLGAASIAPVNRAWICPVTRKVLAHTAFGYSPYGHRENSPFARQKATEIVFPSLPTPFPSTDADRDEISRWLREEPSVVDLRQKRIWGNLHDRAALLAPYIRAEEHSAQQPPLRLRAFENEFKAGKINILACSTTMEMGIDIGSISSVMMTNVPPSIANYRQRVGRAGRRKQGFATSFTLARDTALDRETFRRPDLYLKRQLRLPLVKLDSSRIVQRHVNAYFLASWFAEHAGELIRMNVGTFFGCPDSLDLPSPESCPVGEFQAWLEKPSVRTKMSMPVGSLTRGTALEADAGIFQAACVMFLDARSDFADQWNALRSEAELATSEAARKSILIQLHRLCREHLLKELANRGLLPSHGFPTAVIPFINDCRDSRERNVPGAGEAANAFAKRYDYPSRDADIAIREYAPGAEVVIDGLVWRSAGVTLNWQRPAHLEDLREIQSLRHFWQCSDCGAADCSHVSVDHCPSCASPKIQSRRFLSPAGFRVDWNEVPHADTDKIDFIEPEPARISAKGAAWEPLFDPGIGRGRATHDGLVFFGSAGKSRRGYRVCLDCGRAEEEPHDHENPLAEHTPLRGGKPGEDRFCPGGAKPFAVTEPISLGHEITTDVAELQPVRLESVGSAWALVSALREALSRRLGIQPAELGMGVEPRRGPLGQATHSVFLFDGNAGGAGFSPRLFDDIRQMLEDARAILDCHVAGCERGCAACVLAADMFAQQEIVDRKAALACVVEALEQMRAPQSDDAALPGAVLSPPAADDLSRRMNRGDILTIFASSAFDIGSLSNEPFHTLFAATKRRSIATTLAIADDVFKSLGAAERLGVRDAAIRHGFSISTFQPPEFPNQAALLATLQSVNTIRAWLSRDQVATAISADWARGQMYPVISGMLGALPQINAVTEDALLPRSSAGVVTIEEDKGRALKLFGNWFIGMLAKELAPLALWQPGELASLMYSDRYLRSPLNAILALKALSALKDVLAGKDIRVPLRMISSEPGQSNGHGPYLLFHDWVRPHDRGNVLQHLSGALKFDVDLKLTDAQHARELRISYKSGATARLYFDQGFGYWRALAKERFDFGASPEAQARALLKVNPFVCGSGSTYFVASRLR